MRKRLGGPTILLSLALVATATGGARSQEAPAPAQITLVPMQDSASTGSCNEFTVRAFDAGGAPVAGTIVDVLQTLTDATTEPDENRELFFCDPLNPAGPSPTGQGGAAIGDVSGNNPSQIQGEAGRNTTVRAEVGPTDAGGAVTFGIMLRPSALNGEVSLTAWADLDGDDVAETGEPADTSTNSWLHSDPPVSSIDASPEASTNPNDTRHTVTVLATSMGQPAVGFVPDSVIVGNAAGRPAADVADPNVGTSPNAAPGNFNAYDCTPTNSQGVSTCTFNDPAGSGPGTDTVVFFADRGGTAGVPDLDTDPQDAVQKTWVMPPPPPPPNAEPDTDTNPVGTQHAIVVFGIGSNEPARADILPGSANARSQMPAEIGCVRDHAQDPTPECAYTGTGAGTDTIRVFVDSNDNRIFDQGERFDEVTKHWTDAQSSESITELNAEPETDTNPVGTTHQVTVTVTGASGAVSGATPSSVIAGNASGRPAGDVADPNAGASPNAAAGNGYVCTPSNAQGVSTCTFDDSANPGPAGTDTIAFYVNEAGGTPGPDANEPQDTVQKTWTPDQDAPAARNIVLCHEDPGVAGCDTSQRLTAAGDHHEVAALVTDGTGTPLANVPVEFRESGPGYFTSSVSDSFVALTDAAGVARAVVTSDVLGTSSIVAEISPPGTPGGFRGPEASDDACEQPAEADGSPSSGNCVSAPVSVYWEVPPPTPALCSDGLDNDGDHLIDYPEDPGCTDEFDESETPAPHPGPTFHDRIVHLHFDHVRGDLLVFGRVNLAQRSGLPDCARRLPVNIQRRTDGQWETLATTTTNARRRFAARVADTAGRYRAVAVRAETEVDDELHVCRRAKKAKPHRHRR